MNVKLQYPGDIRLEKLEDRVRMVGTSPSIDIATSVLDDLSAASDAGLSLDGTARAVRVFSTIAGYVTPSQIVGAQSGTPAAHARAKFVEHLLSAARSTWVPQIGLLDPDGRIRAWEAIDNLFATVVSAHLHEEVTYLGLRHVDKCEFPATATAAMLARRMVMLGLIDQRLLQLVEFLQNNARFPQEMALARAISSRLDFQIHSALTRRSGAILEALNQLRSVDEAVTDTFGSEFFVDVSGTEGREVAELLTRRVLAVKQEWNLKDPFANNYVEFIIGRVDAGAGNPDHAIRVFQQMIRAGFAPFDSTLYLALLLTSEGRQDEARQALESLVATCAIPVEFAEGFGGAATAYRRAGGDHARLLKAFPMEELVEVCRANRARIDAEYTRTAIDDRQRALDAFWLDRTERLLAGIGKALEPSDFDALSSSGRPSRTVKLPESILTQSALDDMPRLSPIARTTFVEATRIGVPASEMINQLFEIANMLGGDFGAMARLVPAWAYSQSIAFGRLDEAIKARNSPAIQMIMNQYLDLPGVPSELLAALYVRAMDAADRPASIERMLGVGIKYWKTVRGGSGVAILRVLRPAALKVLASGDARAIWASALEALLDTIPDDDTRKALAEWYLTQKVSGDGDTSGQGANREGDLIVFNAGRMLAERIGPPFDDAVRAHLRGLVLAGRQFDARRASAVQLNARIELINEWCARDPVADRMIVDWFNLWVCSRGGFNAADYDEMADTAFLAIKCVSDTVSKRDIAETALDILKVRLDGCRDDRSLAESVISRIQALSAYVPEASDLVEIHREEQKDSRMTRYAVIFGVAGVAAAVLILLFYYAC